MGLGGYDLGDEPPEWRDSGRGLAGAKDLGAVDIPSGQVLQRAAAGVFDSVRGGRWGPAGSEECRRMRAWMEVFSSAETT